MEGALITNGRVRNNYEAWSNELILYYHLLWYFIPWDISISARINYAVHSVAFKGVADHEFIRTRNQQTWELDLLWTSTETT
jgi:hypothetical protein